MIQLIWSLRTGKFIETENRGYWGPRGEGNGDLLLIHIVCWEDDKVL